MSTRAQLIRQGFIPSGEGGDPAKLWSRCERCGGLVYVDLRTRDRRPIGTGKVDPNCRGCST